MALAAACGGEEASPPPDAPAATTAPTTTAVPTETVAGLPKPVFTTHAGLLYTASAGDYEELRPFLDRSVFLSDFGFGKNQPDPIERWKAMGPEPLGIMGVLLRMPHAVKETGEGTLYEWPRFDANSEPEDIKPAEREAFLSFMTEDELVSALTPDYGYTGPRLGILADGTWWFFVSGGAP
ncbi:MAG: hypothetical protein ACRDM8_04705 [Gaiellaceae bacterium]